MEVLAGILLARDPQAMAATISRVLHPAMFSGLREGRLYAVMAALATHGVRPTERAILDYEADQKHLHRFRVVEGDVVRAKVWRGKPDPKAAAVRVYLSAVRHGHPELRRDGDDVAATWRILQFLAERAFTDGAPLWNRSIVLGWNRWKVDGFDPESIEWEVKCL
jgi:hypothetical protein